MGSIYTKLGMRLSISLNFYTDPVYVLSKRLIMTTKILVADDNPSFLASCITQMQKIRGHIQVDQALNPNECLNKVKSDFYDVVILDISFTPENREGLDLINPIRKKSPKTEIIVLTGLENRELSRASLSLGAVDFIRKGKGTAMESLASKLLSCVEKRNSKRGEALTTQTLADRVGAIYKSEKMAHVFSKALRAQKFKNLNVIIRGETGVGKELVAKAIAADPSQRPYVEVNCGAIQSSLIESELFGHVKGAFTGAMRDRKGFFEAAHQGDIFLDEIQCLPKKAQAALLRITESGSYRRVGESNLRNVKTRVIAATNMDLDKMVQDGEFREDLLARLRTLEIIVPPLRERKEDIPVIAQMYLKKYFPKVEIAEECLDEFMDYHWPRNVRQLLDTLKAMASSGGSLLTLGDIPDFLWRDMGSGHQKLEARIHVSLGLDWKSGLELFEKKFLEAKIASLDEPTTSSLVKSLGVSRATAYNLLKKSGIALEKNEEKRGLPGDHV